MTSSTPASKPDDEIELSPGAKEIVHLTSGTFSNEPDDELDSILKDIESYHYELWDGHLESAKKRLLAWRDRNLKAELERMLLVPVSQARSYAGVSYVVVGKIEDRLAELKPEPLNKEDV